MMVFGTRMFGKCDRVPGLFYVATIFAHINYLPLLPTKTYLVFDDGSERGLDLPMSGKSIAFGYLRAAFIFGAIAAVVIGLIMIGEGNRRPENMPLGGGLVLLAVALMTTWWFSYRLSNPSLERALHLGGLLGIEPEVVAAFYAQAAGTTAHASIDDIPNAPDKPDAPDDLESRANRG